MRAATSWLFAAAALFSSCHAAGIAEGGDQQVAAPLTMQRKGEAERPLAPSILEYRHVESLDAGASPRTYIQTLEGDRWTRTFGNLTFGWGDPYVTGLTGESSTPRRIVVRGQLERLDSANAVFDAIRGYSADLRIPDLGPTARAYVFLFPKRADFDRTLAAAGSTVLPGLRRFAALTPQCSYARLHLDQGNRQAAILLLHIPDLTVSLDDPQDRACIEGFFEQNLLLPPAQVQRLLYPAGVSAEEGCTVARVLRPLKGRPAPALETAGCPIAPIRRAEVLTAYAGASGLGLKPDEARRIIESTKSTCKQQLERGQINDESCRSVLQGEK